ncbi:TPA: hypothetical protein ACN315_000407 [Vibrio parahaemolyticus]
MELTLAIINTNSDGLVIGKGRVKHPDIVSTYHVPVGELPDDFDDSFSSYTYVDGIFTKKRQATKILQIEQNWQVKELAKVNAAIVNYLIDSNISDELAELRISTVTYEDYVALLEYRKQLNVYALSDFSPPRPTASVSF